MATVSVGKTLNYLFKSEKWTLACTPIAQG